MIIKAPAKVNLFLEVEGERKDGYHNITTVFLKIALFDRLVLVKKRSGVCFECPGARIPGDETNTVLKAVKLLQDYTGKNPGAHIVLEKRIPAAAGLGGGSSDAAAVLLGLNKLWNFKLSLRDLMRLGRKIGADVPVFLLPHTAVLARGRGDILKPLDFRPKLWIIIVNPRIAVSTGEIYRRLPEHLTKRRNNVKFLIYALQKADIALLGSFCFNRLEQITFRKYNRLAQIKKRMSALGIRAVLMSGSGSVIFGVLGSKAEAQRAKDELRGMREVLVVKSL